MTEQKLLNRLISSFSYSGDALKSTSYADDAIVSGSGFLVEKNFTITNASPTRYILLDYSTYVTTETWQQGLIYILPPVLQSTGGPVNMNVYRGTDYAGGTEFDAINPNTTATKTTSGTTWTLDPTGSTKGDLVLEYLVGQDSTSQNSGGDSTSGLSFFIRPNTDKTLVEIVNNSGSDITFHYGQLLFEI